MNQDYINKTRQAVNFLCHLYSDDMEIVATIHTMQVEGRTEDLIKELCVVLDFSQALINELKKIGG